MSAYCCAVNISPGSGLPPNLPSPSLSSTFESGCQYYVVIDACHVAVFAYIFEFFFTAWTGQGSSDYSSTVLCRVGLSLVGLVAVRLGRKEVYVLICRAEFEFGFEV
jgi:hypothetical protein